jgi:hypothetical protein
MDSNHTMIDEEISAERDFDGLLRKVQEPTEQLRGLQNDVDALAASVHGQVQEMVDSRPGRAYGDTDLRRLEALIVILQDKAAQAYKLAAGVADDVDRGIRDVPRKK